MPDGDVSSVKEEEDDGEFNSDLSDEEDAAAAEVQIVEPGPQKKKVRVMTDDEYNLCCADFAKSMANVTNSGEFEDMRNAFNEVLQRTQKAFNKEASEQVVCFHCNAGNDKVELRIISPCYHVVCAHCLINIFEEINQYRKYYKCPECTKTIEQSRSPFPKGKVVSRLTYRTKVSEEFGDDIPIRVPEKENK